MFLSRIRSIPRLAVVAGLALVAVSAVATGALGGRASLQPNSVAGQAEFKTAGCGACHVFAAAKSKGKIGPNLDAASLSLTQIEKQITLGGYSVMGIAAKKKYPFPMAAFKGKLSTAEIANIAAFVFVSRNPAAVPKGTTTSGSSGGSSGSSGSGGSTGSSGSGGSTGGSGGSTGGGGGGAANNGCPAGTTIQSSGATDNDDDDGGGPTDNDGCI